MAQVVAGERVDVRCEVQAEPLNMDYNLHLKLIALPVKGAVLRSLKADMENTAKRTQESDKNPMTQKQKLGGTPDFANARELSIDTLFSW